MSAEPELPELPEDKRLAAVARALEEVKLLGEVRDSRWRVVYITSELRALFGIEPDMPVGLGLTAVRRTLEHPDLWQASVTGQRAWFDQETPFVLHDLSPGELAEAFGPLADRAAQYAPAPAPPAWAGAFEWVDKEGPTEVSRLSVRLCDADGAAIGFVTVYTVGLPGRLVVMMSRGNPGMYLRMLRLSEPARRPAAILFADLESSGVHARRLSTGAYFRLIRDLTTAIDEAIVANTGIVGKHAGDGATAFFLAEDLGSEPAAAAAAIEAARAVRSAPAALDGAPEGLAVNVGVHWGATLVIGQIVTGGRLEVTALGDEVNIAARVQEVASGGRLLASKDVIERLPADAAERLGLDPLELTYQTIAELPGAGGKAVRDAGAVPVVELWPR